MGPNITALGWRSVYAIALAIVQLLAPQLETAAEDTAFEILKDFPVSISNTQHPQKDIIRYAEWNLAMITTKNYMERCEEKANKRLPGLPAF